jgi:tetratricopeptide (TPR) repeat protein
VVNANETALRIEVGHTDEWTREASHYVHWLHYGYLQQGRYRQAESLLETARGRLHKGAPARERGYYGTLYARQLVETGAWRSAGGWDAPAGVDIPSPNYHFARALAAIERGDLDTARENARLVQPGGAGNPEVVLNGDVVGVLRLEIEAKLASADGDQTKAIALLQEAATREKAMPPTFGPPKVVKPAAELLGDIMVEVGRTDEAVMAYTAQLERTPRRAAALLGLARAARASNDMAISAEAHRELALIWRSADEDVRKFLETDGGEGEIVCQELQIGIIDFYGLNRVSAAQVRQALTFRKGDTISLVDDERPAFLVESENRLSMLSGVTRARANIVCCDQGRAIVYIGIEERGAAVMRFRAVPRGTARLAADIVQAGDEFSKALMLAAQSGDTAEDDSQGHAFAHDPEMRAIQARFVIYSDRDLPELRRVLRDSSDPEHRALAAQILGYAAEKQTVVKDLVHGMSDPSENVRNNAMRALLVFAKAAPTAARPVPRVPYQPFIALLNSPVWSDRNKASGALAALSKDRDPQLLARLRNDAIAPLVEMSRWTSDGHALFPFMILGRIAGYSDKAALSAWNRGEREIVISAALDQH